MFKAEPPKVEVPIKGLWDHIRAKGLCSTPLENAGRSGVYESGTMKPSLLLCLLFFSKLSSLHYPTNLPIHHTCSFHSFSLSPCPFVSMCHSSEALLRSLLPPFSNFPEYHNFLLCLEQVTPTTITCSFLPRELSAYLESAILLMQLGK